jgi:hypothetical protein
VVVSLSIPQSASVFKPEEQKPTRSSSNPAAFIGHPCQKQQAYKAGLWRLCRFCEIHIEMAEKYDIISLQDCGLVPRK